VLGAGPCGIAATSTFLKAGVNVAVLEARDRVGGRAFTNNDELDLGPQHICYNNTENPMLKKAQEYGVDMYGKYDVKVQVATSLDGAVSSVTQADRDHAEEAFDKCMD
jgi:putrescine oxidase